MSERKPLLERVFGFVIKYIGVQQLVILIFLLAALLSTTLGVASVVRGINSQPLWIIGAIGVLIAWGLASRSVANWASIGGGTMIGVLLVLIRMGNLGGMLWQTLYRAGNLVTQGVRYLVQGAYYLGTTLISRLGISALQFSPTAPLIPQTRPFLNSLELLLIDTGVLFNRLADWIVALIQRQALYDPVAASVAWGVLIWIAAFWAGWITQRKNKPLLAVTPWGIMLSAILSYTGARTSSLLFLMGLGLVLMALVHQRDRERTWELIGIDFSEDIGSEIIVMAISTALALTLTAAIVPAISIGDMVDWAEDRLETWRERNRGPDTVAESLGVEPQPQPVPRAGTFENVATGGLPRRHLIGSGPELSERIVMVIQTGELQPVPAEALFEAPPNHYWRSLTYDTYTGRGWATSRTETRSYEAGEPVQAETSETQRVLNQRVRIFDETERLLYAAGELVTVQQPFDVAWRRGTGDDIFGVTALSNTYRVRTLVSTATVESLQVAGTAYPDWIAERYLDLPEDLPNRVIDLARDLTATEPSPYERARAIEQYLRNTYPYTLDVPQPPVDQDIADYFLFELQKGYCDYYATAMVVLARAAGLPSRMAVGYITGTYDALNAQYIISEAEAHAWVEVYFPGYGWIKFEPTGGWPELYRPSEQEEPEWEPPEDLATLPGSNQNQRSPLLRYWYLTLLGIGVIMGLIVVVFAALDLLWLSIQPMPKTILRLYGRLRRHAEHLDVPIDSGDTPHEFEVTFTESLRSLSDERRLLHWTGNGVEEISRLIELYVQLNYTDITAAEIDRQGALKTWQRLRWRLWFLRLWQSLRNRWATSSILRPTLKRFRSAYER